eukprot:jgi/Botrbrau1/22861/Bobra.0065s0019.1
MEYSDLSQLSYLNWIFKESMRMSPVIGGMIPRMVLQDLNLRGHFFPKGTILFASVQGTHHHPDNWDRPEEFLPERWDGEGVEYLPEPSSRAKADGGGLGREQSEEVDPLSLSPDEARNRPLRYMPFGSGARQCIGMSLARMNALTTLALLASHFSFRLADKMEGAEGVMQRTRERVSITPGGGLWIHCTSRVPQPLAA